MKREPSIAAGLHLFTSNRLETLAAHLAERLRQPLASPLQSETIVVRNKGMERWLKQELALRHGVCANHRFPFPEAFGHEIFRLLLPATGATPALERDVLAWRILRELPALLDRPEFSPLRHYLDGTPDDRKFIQLATRVANLFDQYLIFRPQLILDWDAGRDGQDAEWQPILWRAIAGEFQGRHQSSLWQKTSALLASTEGSPSALPERISIFGVSALPPFYLDLFAGLASRVQVNLFLLQPSQEYWGDITSPREDERILKRQRTVEIDPFQLHLETGNRLLASMGYLGRDFLKLLLDAGDWVPHEDFSEPGESLLLRLVQSDILHLRDRGRQPDFPILEISREDDSVQVHSCHSPLREMEVLHDQMLDWFQRDPALAPRDIVVMTPDIETYAPFIHAVFGAPEDTSRRIPFSVADRGARRQSQVIDAFLKILSLPDTRLGSATVLALLDTPAIRQHFELTTGDLERIRRWVEETNIRWGADAAHREDLGLPALPGNTWRDGLNRLLLGYCMAGGGENMFGDILPYDDLEGDAAFVLGRFAGFLELLFATVRDLPAARSLEAWADRFETILRQFFTDTEDNAAELQTIRAALQELRRQQTAAGFDAPVSLAVILERLTPVLEEDLHHVGFLTGGVTFCGLKPMRSIPFKIVCLVGMDDSVFPRPVQHLSFDLMARHPRLGDRSTREDDRYLFLETLLSARERLHLSYVGQSIRDNTEAPPSVLVSELLDYLEQAFALAPADRSHRREAAEPNLRAHLVTRHRLQAFHEDYFTPGHRLFSYSRENCHASTTARLARQRPGLFLAQPLAAPDAPFRQVSIDDLARFFGNPARFLLCQRLNIHLPEGEPELPEREAFQLDALQGFQLRQELVATRAASANAPGSFALQQAGGRLPLGDIGEVDFGQCAARVRRFLVRLQRHQSPDTMAAVEPQAVDLVLGDFRLSGQLAPRGIQGLLLYRCGKVRPADILRIWIHHLVANVIASGQTSGFLGDDAFHSYRPPDDPRTLLIDLLELYWRGLSEPLKFFPKSALALVEAEQQQSQKSKGKPGTKAPLAKALEAWEGSDFPKRDGEKDDPYVSLCFQHVEPLDDDFIAIARRVFLPVLAHEQREEF